MHIINVSSQTLFETILQIINATAIGMLLGSIYYKTKNIWSVIFLHGFYDFAIFLGEINLIKDCTYGNPTLGITIVECISIITISLYWIFGALKVLNTPSSKNEKINKKKDYFYTTMIVITFILIFVPFSSLVPEYENYKTCYEYMEIDSFNNYEVHYPVHDKYYINEKELITRLEEETDGKEIVEVTNKIEYLISFKLNDNKTVNIKNENTTYEVQLPYKNVEQMELVENEDYFFSVIYTTENDGTVYYTEIKKSDLRNSRDLIDFIAGSYKSYAVPELSRVGYINIESNVEKYPYLVSSNNDVFIIKNDNIFLINKGI
jgi:hypothetical protein